MIKSSQLLRRIRAVARIVRWLALLIMIAIVLVAAIELLKPWLAGTPFAVELGLEFPGVRQGDLRLAGWLTLLPATVLLYGLVRLMRMMRACEQAAFFTSLVPAHLQAFSASILICELLQISLPLQVALVRWAMHQGFIAHFGTAIELDQVLSLLLAMVFLILSWILREAARLAEDNASIV